MRIFIKSNKEKGQIAPFLIAVIVILLTAMMVTVNLGKISMTKTHTSNAADAGALAGASTMANGLNAIADISDQMLADYLIAVAILGSCKLQCSKAWTTYGAHVASQLALWGYANSVAGDTLEEAEVMAKQMAFSNAGIDETKPRDDNESYEEWLQRKSRFEDWMDKNKYEDEDTYKWSDSDFKYGQESRSESELSNEVTVDVVVPKAGLIKPLPGPIAVLGWNPCPPDGSPKCCCKCWCMAGISTTAGLWEVPWADKEIMVTVTRVEPSVNLGLWRMRYSGSSGGGIRSRSWAQAYGGTILPPHTSDTDYYDSRLTHAD